MSSLYVTVLWASVCVTAVFGALAWRRRAEPGARALTLLFGAVLVWGGVYAVALGTHDRALRLLLQRVLWVGVAVAPVAWFVFALRYTGHGDRLTRPVMALLGVPAVAVVALVWTNAAHGLVWSESHLLAVDGVALLSLEFGVVFWLFVAYAYTLVLAGIVVLLQLVFTAEHLFVDQALALVLGTLFPLVVNVVSLAGHTPLPGLNLTPYAFAASSVAFSYALYQADLLERVPATRRIGRTAVVRNMDDGVIVLDDTDVVVDANPTAEWQFDRDRANLVGQPVTAVFDDPDFEVPAGEETVVWSADGPREFEVRTSVLTDQHDRLVGRVLVVRDITDRHNRRQQLQVLNRVLRHNFRNDMNVIDVCATHLADRLTGEERDLAERVRTVARDLAETSTKAREIERILSRREAEPQPVDLPSLITRHLDTLRHEYPGVVVDTEMPAALEIQSTGVLESALRNVLENAVAHNDASEPRVRVTVRSLPTDDVEIAVADNGPGIPEQERNVLLTGTETPLEHGSGLGLWLVNWAVTMLGGDVAFADNDPRGSVVTIRVPRHGPTVSARTAERSQVDAT